LAKPSALTPSKNAYVVWIEGKDKQPQNVGQLRVNDKLESILEATTPNEHFDIFITAEDNPNLNSLAAREFCTEPWSLKVEAPDLERASGCANCQ
jgi:hypothetical protein